MVLRPAFPCLSSECRRESRGSLRSGYENVWRVAAPELLGGRHLKPKGIRGPTPGGEQARPTTIVRAQGLQVRWGVGPGRYVAAARSDRRGHWFDPSIAHKSYHTDSHSQVRGRFGWLGAAEHSCQNKRTASPTDPAAGGSGSCHNLSHRRSALLCRTQRRSAESTGRWLGVNRLHLCWWGVSVA